VISLNPDDVCTLAQWAAEHDIPRATVHSWARRYPDFPAPLLRTSYVAIWSTSAIDAWLSAQG